MFPGAPVVDNGANQTGVTTTIGASNSGLIDYSAGDNIAAVIAAINQEAGPYPDVAAKTTATYAMPLSEDGYTYTNTGAAVDTLIQLPASAPLGFTAAVYCDNGGQNIGFDAPPGETIQIGGSVSSAGGTLSTGALGCYITIRKIFTSRWATVAAAGTVGALT